MIFLYPVRRYITLFLSHQNHSLFQTMLTLCAQYHSSLLAYWMLKPSNYNDKLGLWVWTPKYDDGEDAAGVGDTTQEDNQFEMPLGSTVRFRVKAINFTQVTSSPKGLQATTTSTATSNPSPGKTDSSFPVRKRSTSIDLTDTEKMPACMHITASICEDGLGIISWWTTAEQDDTDDHPISTEDFVDDHPSTHEYPMDDEFLSY